VRLSYQSKESNSTSSQSENEVQVIAAALARLRRTSASDEISADSVNAMIKIIQGERALTASLSQWCFHNQRSSLGATVPTKQPNGFWIELKENHEGTKKIVSCYGFINL